MQKSDVYLVSDLPDDFVKGIFFKPYQELQSAVNHAFSHKGLDAKVIIGALRRFHAAFRGVSGKVTDI